MQFGQVPGCYDIVVVGTWEKVEQIISVPLGGPMILGEDRWSCKECVLVQVHLLVEIFDGGHEK